MGSISARAMLGDLAFTSTQPTWIGSFRGERRAGRTGRYDAHAETQPAMSSTSNAIGNAVNARQERTNTSRNRIKARREILQPTPVALNRVPRWLRLRLLAATRGRRALGASVSGLSLWGDAQLMFGIRFDHFGTTTYCGKPAFCSEFYDLVFAEMSRIETLCRAIGCEWTLQANSWWYPGETLRVILFEADDPSGSEGA